MTKPSHLMVGDRRIAYKKRRGSGPTLVFLPGYASDMEGTKALALDAFAKQHQVAMLRFDYSGTGSSSGRFEDGTFDLWLEETLELIDQLTEGPLVILGSSMGGWIALHLGLARPDRIQALVGIAAAPDFTDWGFGPEQRERLMSLGRLENPDRQSSETGLLTKAFWESGQRSLLLKGEIAIDCPVHLIHGEKDQEVPLEIAFRTMRALRSGNVQLKIVKGGTHRLSQPHEIDAILRSVGALLEPSS